MWRTLVIILVIAPVITTVNLAASLPHHLQVWRYLHINKIHMLYSSSKYTLFTRDKNWMACPANFNAQYYFNAFPSSVHLYEDDVKVIGLDLGVVCQKKVDKHWFRVTWGLWERTKGMNDHAPSAHLFWPLPTCIWFSLQQGCSNFISNYRKEQGACHLNISKWQNSNHMFQK